MSPMIPGLIEDFVARQGVMIIDGGLATALEARGCDLDDPLWSARLLLEDPEQIRQVHGDYLAAGADCIITATYQASEAGFRTRGLAPAEVLAKMEAAVDLAVAARDAFWNDPGNRGGRLRPVVAASIGPYGAARADGSEYSGDYGVDDADLYAFHAVRWRVLAESSADILACETLPSAREAGVLLRLLREAPHARAWFSFSCRDGVRLSDGTLLSDILRICDAAPNVAGLGINCTAPRHVPSLIRDARAVTEKPLVVYPNSGETYDARTKTWRTGPSLSDWVTAAAAWRDLGASGVGGCCRVGPAEISALRTRLLEPRTPDTD